MTPFNSPVPDIKTPRMILRLMERAVVDACLLRDLPTARRLLDADIPVELFERMTALEFAQKELADDPLYRPWSARAMILAETRTMIGTVRFHSRPDPEYLHPFARDAVEIGYRVFPAYRQQGYAGEAVRAAIQWAKSEFGVNRFAATVSPHNAPSLALLARLGFRKVGRHVDAADGIEDVYLRASAD